MLAKIAEWTDAVCDMASTPAEKQAAETVLTATCDMIGAVSMGIAYGVDNMPNPDLLLKGLFEIADHFVPAGYCIGMEDRRLGVYPLMRQSISTRNGKPIIQ
ncbi:MAG TPA: hypothetical protein VF077_00535 [Nitrospiraceae bacterium]